MVDIPSRIRVDDEIILRPFARDDGDNFFACYDSPLARRGFLDVPQSISQANKELKEVLKEYDKDKPSRICLAIMHNNQFAGFVELEDLNERSFEHRASIGYSVIEQFRGKNIATRAAGALTDFAFETLNIQRVEGICRVHNKASMRVLEKAGFAREGVLRDNCKQNDGFIDDVIYSKLREK